jgi:hypothetical protein
MSGLLRRLASRALGVTPTVRPVVGWTAETDTRATAQAPALTFESGVEPETAPRRNAGDPPSRAAPEVAPSTSVEQLLPGRTTSAAMEIDVPAASKHLPSPLPVGAAEARAAPPRAGAEVDDLRPAPVDRTEASRAATRDEPRDAPLLLPPQRVGRALPAPAIAAANPLPAGAARPASEETTEVHVTIGRIEVTAVQEAARPRREPARSRKPKSLEEYLAGRQGRRA